MAQAFVRPSQQKFNAKAYDKRWFPVVEEFPMALRHQIIFGTRNLLSAWEWFIPTDDAFPADRCGLPLLTIQRLGFYQALV